MQQAGLIKADMYLTKNASDQKAVYIIYQSRNF